MAALSEAAEDGSVLIEWDSRVGDDDGCGSRGHALCRWLCGWLDGFPDQRDSKQLIFQFVLDHLYSFRRDSIIVGQCSFLRKCLTAGTTSLLSRTLISLMNTALRNEHPRGSFGEFPTLPQMEPILKLLTPNQAAVDWAVEAYRSLLESSPDFVQQFETKFETWKRTWWTALNHGWSK